MEPLITADIETPDGIADCMLELQETDNSHYYAATILYPHMVNGYSRTEVHCCNITINNGIYELQEGDDGLHPKIKKLEATIISLINLNNK